MNLNFRIADLIALLALVFGFIFIVQGLNSFVGTVLLIIMAWYFGHRSKNNPSDDYVVVKVK